MDISSYKKTENREEQNIAVIVSSVDLASEARIAYVSREKKILIGCQTDVFGLVSLQIL